MYKAKWFSRITLKYRMFKFHDITTSLTDTLRESSLQPVLHVRT